MENTKREVARVIEEIEREKREGRVVPGYAMDMEVRARFPGREAEVRSALNEMYKAGEISVGRTLNNIWIKRNTNTEGRRKSSGNV